MKKTTVLIETITIIAARAPGTRVSGFTKFGVTPNGGGASGSIGPGIAAELDIVFKQWGTGRMGNREVESERALCGVNSSWQPDLLAAT
jgi:hypothetical protein